MSAEEMLQMIRIWKKMGVDRVLQAAYEKGIVLCGISAGSICWFESGHSDSMSFYHPDNWKYMNVRGLGFLKGIHCPHYDGETLGIPRKQSFQDMISKIGGLGIAIDNNCAIEFIDGTYRVITSKPRAGAYRVYKEKGKVVSKKIEEKTDFSPISELYLKS
jgi:dipeptidase E